MSFAGYSTILSLGFNAAVSREVARTSVSADTVWTNQVVNSTTSLFLVTGTIAFFVLAVSSFFLSTWFNIPPAFYRPAQIALIVLGFELGLRLPLSIFPSILGGQQRYVESETVRIFVRVVYVAAIFLAFRTYASMVTLSLIVLFTSIIRLGLQWNLVRKATPWLEFSRRWVSLAVVKKLAGFSLSSFIYLFSQQIMSRANYFVIAVFLTAADVGVFNIPSRLVEFMLFIAVGMTGVVMPVASELEAKGDLERLKAVFFLGTKYVVMVSMPLIIAFVVLGKSVLLLWVGKEFVSAHLVLVLLTVAVGFQVSQAGVFNVLMGMGKHVIFSRITVSTAVFTVALSVLLIRGFGLGLEGAALANLICYAAAYGVILPLYACRQLKVSFLRYWFGGIGKPLLLGLPIGIATLLLRSMIEPRSLFLLLLEFGALFFVYLLSSWFVILTKEERTRLLRVFRPSPSPQIEQ
jgi:O-antigen/teichoic acid export membrane protein